MSHPVTTLKTTKHRVPHAKDPEHPLVGVLEQLEPEKPTQGRRIALILHGSMGHKDYLFQKRLGMRLPIDSFRFDFYGNYESLGSTDMGTIERDIDDIEAVVQYLTTQLGYVIDLLVGHSRGVVAGVGWMCHAKEASGVRGFVNVSGRYRMPMVYDNLSEATKQQLKTKGFYIREAVIARQPVAQRSTKEDLEAFMNFDTSVVWDKFPQETDVLTLHGLADNIVTPYDAIIYARAFGARSPGTHNLCYIEEADHNFTGRQDEVVEIILKWIEQMEARTLKTGIWETGVRIMPKTAPCRL